MTVRLAKGERLSLRQVEPGRMRMTLGWKAVHGRRSRPIDLDASALLYAERTPSDVVYFHHLVSNDGSVRHLGESLTGSERGDESIVVDLAQVPVHLTQIVFTLSSYIGQSFSEVESAHCWLVDEATGSDLAHFEFAADGPHTGQIVAKLHHEPSRGWAMQAIGAAARARSFHALLPAIDAHL